MSLVPVPSARGAARDHVRELQRAARRRPALLPQLRQARSPVRLAFLDALGPTGSPPPPAGALPAAWAPGGYELTPSGYVPIQENGAAGWARRNSGLIGLLAVLVLCLLTGLLVGHWVSQSKTPREPDDQESKASARSAPARPAAGAAKEASSTTGGESSTPAASKASASENKKDEEAGKHETAKEKAPPAKPKPVSKAKINKLTQSTGKKHQEEINSLGAEPIETG